MGKPERVGGDHARRVELHPTDVARLVRRVAAVHEPHVRRKSAPVVTVGGERREHQREVVGEDALLAIFPDDMRDRARERTFVLPRTTQNDYLALLNWRERCEHPRSLVPQSETQRLVDEPEVVEIVASLLLVV